jgi:hypothetical protein
MIKPLMAAVHLMHLRPVRRADQALRATCWRHYQRHDPEAIYDACNAIFASLRKPTFIVLALLTLSRISSIGRSIIKTIALDTIKVEAKPPSNNSGLSLPIRANSQTLDAQWSRNSGYDIRPRKFVIDTNRALSVRITGPLTKIIDTRTALTTKSPLVQIVSLMNRGST